jgi:hypothetical protein
MGWSGGKAQEKNWKSAKLRERERERKKERKKERERKKESWTSGTPCPLQQIYQGWVHNTSHTGPKKTYTKARVVVGMITVPPSTNDARAVVVIENFMMSKKNQFFFRVKPQNYLETCIALSVFLIFAWRCDANLFECTYHSVGSFRFVLCLTLSSRRWACWREYSFA